MSYLFNEKDWTVGDEEDGDDEQYWEDCTQPAEDLPIDECASQVHEEDPDRQEQLEEGTEGAAEGSFSDLRDEHRGDHTGSSGGDAGEDSASVQHSDVRGQRQQRPADEVRNANRDGGPSSSDSLSEDTRRKGAQEGADSEERSDPAF